MTETASDASPEAFSPSSTGNACEDGFRDAAALSVIAEAAERRLRNTRDRLSRDSSNPATAAEADMEALAAEAEQTAEARSRRAQDAALLCDFVDHSRDTSRACHAVVTLWADRSRAVDDAQHAWADTVNNWDVSPGDLRAAAAAARGFDDRVQPDERLAYVFEQREAAMGALASLHFTSATPWESELCAFADSTEACAAMVGVLSDRRLAADSAAEASAARQASYATPEDDTAETMQRLLDAAELVAERVC